MTLATPVPTATRTRTTVRFHLPHVRPVGQFRDLPAIVDEIVAASDYPWGAYADAFQTDTGFDLLVRAYDPEALAQATHQIATEHGVDLDATVTWNDITGPLSEFAPDSPVDLEAEALREAEALAEAEHDREMDKRAAWHAAQRLACDARHDDAGFVWMVDR